MHSHLPTLVNRAWQDISVNNGPVVLGIDAAATEDNWGVCVLTLSPDLQMAQMPLLLPQQRINSDGQISPTLLFRPTKDLLLGFLSHVSDMQLFSSVAVDIPFGWSDGHRAFVNCWSAQAGWLVGEPMPERQDFERRMCDIAIRRKYPFIRPLSVGADKIAQAAFCWSLVRQQLTRFAMGVDFGLEPVQARIALFETYPAAFVKLAAADFGNYKKSPAVRRQLLATLSRQYNLSFPPHQADCLEWACEQRGSPDAFDAFLCALSAWDHIRNRLNPGSIPLTTPSSLLNRMATQPESERIHREGWILVRER